MVGCQHGDANSDLRLKLNTHDVAEIDVFEIPSTVSTPSDVTAEQLERGSHAELRLRGGALPDHLDDLDHALATTECKKSAPAVDLRTAVIFLDSNHKKIRSFYYGMNGKGGQIDQVPCELTQGLYRWARKYLPG
jgi:hypothetical protein